MWNRLHDEMESDRATRYGPHSSKSRKSDWTGASFPAVEPDRPCGSGRDHPDDGGDGEQHGSP